MALRNPDRSHPASFDVALGDHRVTADFGPSIARIGVFLEWNAPDVVELVLVNRPGRDFVSDLRLSLGAPVAIGLGYGSQLDNVFQGYITDLQPSFEGESSSSTTGPTELFVRARDARHFLDLTPQFSSFLSQKASDIVLQLVARVAPVLATDSKQIIDFAFQYGTDLQFIGQLCELSGFELVRRDKTFLFRPINLGEPPEATLKFAGGVVLSANMKQTLPFERLIARSYDPEQKNFITDVPAPPTGSLTASSRATDVSMGKTFATVAARRAFDAALGSAPADDVAERGPRDLVLLAEPGNPALLHQRAASEFKNRTLKYITGEIRCRGINLMPGSVVQMEGFGRFSGPNYVFKVNHEYTGELISTVEVGRNAS